MLEPDQIIERLTAIEACLQSNGSPWLNIREASTYTRVSTTTLRRWIHAGKLKVHRVNDGKLLIHKRDIDALLMFDTQKTTKAQRQKLNDYSI